MAEQLDGFGCTARRSGEQLSYHSFKGSSRTILLGRRRGLEASAGCCAAGGEQKDAQVAEWLMAADCKSAALCATEVRILPCAPQFFSSRWNDVGAGCGVVVERVVDLGPAGSGRMTIALVAIALLGIAAWQTMEPGNFRSLTWVLLAFFAFRVVLGWLRSR